MDETQIESQEETNNDSDEAPNPLLYTSLAPKKGSRAFQKYIVEHARVLNFLFFLTSTMHRIDEQVKIAAKALQTFGDAVDLGDTVEKKQERARAAEKGAGAIRHLRLNRDIFMEMFLCRMVDNYLVYLADLLRLIFEHKPEALRSSETERLDFILSHADMSELVKSLAEKRVHDLSYKGMEDISKYFLDRLGLEMFSNSEDQETTIDLIQKRNLIVHNRGIANAIYVQKSKTQSLALGQRVDFTPDEFFAHLDNLCGAAIHIDERAVKKFGLPIVSWESDSPTG